MKKALIVASGLRGVIGHNYFYTQAVRRELEARGFEVTVFANKHASADFIKKTGFKPVFSLGTYDFIPLNGPLPDLAYLYLQSGIYAYELQAAMREINGENFDLVFCHTVADFELIAWNRFLKKNRLNGFLLVMQRNTPRFGMIEKWKLFFHPYRRIRPRYLNALYRRMKGRFVLLTDSEALSKDYAQIYRHKIVTASIPIEGFAPPDKELDFSPDSIFSRYNLQNNGHVHFGFMGDSRNHKGFSLLPVMIEKVLAAGKDKIDFVIQCPNSEYESALVPPGLRELQLLAENYPGNVTLLYERLSDEDYLNVFRFLNAAMIPYTDPQFTEGTSNVFTEAAALGKPVVVSNNTWMSLEMKKYGGGLEFEKGNTDDFAAKVIELAGNHKSFEKNAKENSQKWREFHNAKNLVDLLLKESNLN